MQDQQEIDRIVKKANAKYLKKLSEKDEELNRCRTVLDEVGQIFNGNSEFYTEQQNAIPSGDDEIIKETERIINIPENERSEEDTRLLEEIWDKYGHALFNKDIEKVRNWAKDNYDGDINMLIADEKFRDYAAESEKNLDDAVKDYIESQKTKVTAKTPGSVKDSSGAPAKEYYSREEVNKMSPAEIKRNMKVIERSMTKW